MDGGVAVRDRRTGRAGGWWYRGSTQTGNPSLKQGACSRNLQTNTLLIYSSFQEVDGHGLRAAVSSCLLSLEMKGG